MSRTASKADTGSVFYVDGGTRIVYSDTCSCSTCIQVPRFSFREKKISGLE